jgi:alkyl sulfatase BDS1-like metallo-beta-lactamase superfamily hydrolase
VALDYGLSNCAMVEVGSGSSGGYVVIDAGSSVAEARRVRQEFDGRVAGGPQAIIYTHFHHDHIAGVTAFHERDMPIWAHETFHREFEYVLSFPRFYHHRAARQFGFGLPPEQVLTNGIGPPLELEAGSLATFLMPTHTFADRESVQMGDVEFELHLAPGESHDQIFVWLPEDRVLFAADNFYRAFPNLYAIRGGKPRPVQEWIDSLDAMRRLDPAPEFLALGHTAPIRGAGEIQRLLTDYRDGIAFVHDSVIRGINAGKTVDQLVHEIQLPARLRDHPYLQPLYGTLAGGIRGIYAGYVGWFDGNASNLQPLTPHELAPQMLDVLGGRAGILFQIRRAAASDPRWVAWLCDLLLAREPGDREARKCKAEALDRLAADTPNPLFRNWYMTDAAILRGEIRVPPRAPLNSQTMQNIPLRQILRRMPQRLHPIRSSKVRTNVGLVFTDSGEQFTLCIREGVGELVDQLLPNTDLVLRLTEDDFRRMICREISPASREFLRRVQCEVPGSPWLSSFRRLYRVMRLIRCIILAQDS